MDSLPNDIWQDIFQYLPPSIIVAVGRTNKRHLRTVGECQIKYCQVSSLADLSCLPRFPNVEFIHVHPEKLLIETLNESGNVNQLQNHFEAAWRQICESKWAKSVKSLDFSNSRDNFHPPNSPAVASRDFNLISNLESIQDLRITQYAETTPQLLTVPLPTTLTTLYLDNVSVTHEVLHNISRCTQLKSLSLRLHVTNSRLKFDTLINSLTQLEYLDLTNCAGNLEWSILKNLPQLTALRVTCLYKDEDREGINLDSLPDGLKILDLNSVGIFELALTPALSRFHALEELNLRLYLSCGKNLVVTISQLSSLKRLSLFPSNANGFGGASRRLPLIAKLTNLESLLLRAHDTANMELFWVDALPKLQHLRVSNNTLPLDAFARCRSLRSFAPPNSLLPKDISTLTQVIHPLETVEFLDLGYVSKNASLTWLSLIDQMPNLKVVKVAVDNLPSYLAQTYHVRQPKCVVNVTGHFRHVYAMPPASDHIVFVDMSGGDGVLVYYE